MDITDLNDYSARNEMEGCLLCYNAPCTRYCTYGMDPAKVIRSLRFNNKKGAKKTVKDAELCLKCQDKTCVKECLKGKIDLPVRIPALIKYSSKFQESSKKNKNLDLGITFLGVKCENPFFLSSSVVASNYEMVARAFEMGWAGVAFKTIGSFVPEEVSPRFSTIRKEGNSFIGFKNIENISDHTLEENIEFLKRLKENYPNKVIIASILGQNDDDWTYLAKCVTKAGVDIIECNFSCPHMTKDGLGSDVGQNPELVAQYTKATRKGTNLPILAKMTPNIGNMEIPAVAAFKAGADGIAAINTIKSITKINLDDFTSEPLVDGKSCVGGYSGKTVKPIALRFIHDMKKHPLLRDVPISGMGGIETWRDAAEFLAIGCGNIQITTSVMQYGYRIIDDLLEGLSLHLEERGLENIEQLIGVALPKIVKPEELNRHSISYPKFDKNKCIGCNRCYISCYDGGHQALEISEEINKPRLKPKKCVGCQLCIVVCPMGAISAGNRVKKI